MVKKRKKPKKEKLDSESKLFAFLATFFSILGFILALIVKRDDKYVMHYAKQSLVIFIASLIVGIISSILAFIPIIGWIIIVIAQILVFALWLVSWVYALSGDLHEVPVIGVYGRKIDL